MSSQQPGWFGWVLGSILIALVPAAILAYLGLQGPAPVVVVAHPPAALPPAPGSAGQTPAEPPLVPAAAAVADAVAELRPEPAVTPPLTGERWPGVRTRAKGGGDVVMVVAEGDGKTVKGTVVSVPDGSGAQFQFEGEVSGREITFTRWPQIAAGKLPKGQLTPTGLVIEVQQPNGGVARFEFTHP